MDPDASIPGDPAPSVFNYVLSFLLVGVAWGFTTPFIRRAAADFNARQERQKQSTTTTTTSATPSPSSPSSDRISLDRGRSQAQSPNSGAEDAQELLPTSEPDVIDLGDLDGGNEVRRRSGSRQREEEQELEYGEPSGHSHRDGHDHVVQQESDTGGIPAPAWMHSSARQSWVRTKIVSVFWTVVNLLRTPAYSIPLVINLTGSIWFFLLVGKHELSLTVPLANSSAFLFTVLGEWYVERKVIAKETWLGLALVLGGIALCVHSKNQTG